MRSERAPRALQLHGAQDGSSTACGYAKIRMRVYCARAKKNVSRTLSRTTRFRSPAHRRPCTTYAGLHALAASRGACVTRCDLLGLPLLLVFRRERKPAPCPRPRRELCHTASPPTSHRTRAETFARFAKDPNLHTFSCMAGGHALRSPQPNSDLKFGLFAPPRKQRPAQP